MTPFIDEDGNVLYGIDNEFGFCATDFIGAEQKVLDGDYAEGFAGKCYDPSDPTTVLGLALRNAETDVFRSGAPLGTWALGNGGETVKASTEHFATMADLLSDHAFPGDADAIAPLGNDHKLLDLRPTGPVGTLEPGLVHDFYIEELAEALQRAIDNVGGADTLHDDLDFDRAVGPEHAAALSARQHQVRDGGADHHDPQPARPGRGRGRRRDPRSLAARRQPWMDGDRPHPAGCRW